MRLVCNTGFITQRSTIYRSHLQRPNGQASTLVSGDLLWVGHHVTQRQPNQPTTITFIPMSSGNPNASKSDLDSELKSLSDDLDVLSTLYQPESHEGLPMAARCGGTPNLHLY